MRDKTWNSLPCALWGQRLSHFPTRILIRQRAVAMGLKPVLLIVGGHLFHWDVVRRWTIQGARIDSFSNTRIQLISRSHSSNCEWTLGLAPCVYHLIAEPVAWPRCNWLTFMDGPSIPAVFCLCTASILTIVGASSARQAWSMAQCDFNGCTAYFFLQKVWLHWPHSPFDQSVYFARCRCKAWSWLLSPIVVRPLTMVCVVGRRLTLLGRASLCNSRCSWSKGCNRGKKHLRWHCALGEEYKMLYRIKWNIRTFQQIFWSSN